MSNTVAFDAATIVGYPRIGRFRELKKAQEAFWKGKITLAELKETAAEIQRTYYERVCAAGLGKDNSSIPATFSYYDQVLDAIRLFTLVPARLAEAKDERGLLDLPGYFALARGTEKLPPLEMTKWFDTNYHYLVPEIGAETEIKINTEALVEQLETAAAAGVKVRPQLVGPLTLLLGAKAEQGSAEDFEPISRLDDFIAAYKQVLAELAERGVEWVQLDEPGLTIDRDNNAEIAELARKTYSELAKETQRPKLLVTSPYGELRENLDALIGTGIEALHLDLVHGKYTPAELAAVATAGITLVAGIINGRNIWKADLRAALAAAEELPGAVVVSSSTSLQHVPHDVTLEDAAEVPVDGLSFADQKVAEIATLARGLAEGAEAVEAELAAADEALARFNADPRKHNDEIRARAAAVKAEDFDRPVIDVRREAQADLNLPKLPTTTIGSFPQTADIRRHRAEARAGKISQEQLDEFLREEIASVIKLQEELDLDVLVHGEAERNDMVQYFAENFDGFATTKHGWVQSYGSRCTRPSVLFGDVKRTGEGLRGDAFTVPWSAYAQSLSERPVKGMLTGPVTILAWSFVRDDQPRRDTANQVALALADEIADLEAAGIRIIQVDEPALRELLPLRRDAHADYLDWSVNSFRLATSGVEDKTQIHTHLCYSEFNEIIDSINALNADVTSIEAARSHMELLADIPETYVSGLGPGVWDIHSPRVPSEAEVEDLIRTAINYGTIADLWINPDCGLKTRDYEETKQSLQNLVAATKAVRASL
ncbi:MAG: 5-methyltetrahydropteroyltriglutamate--homocysteine S-methyltransferase [Rothia sp. (in: high G+C Gram-positive bacteria)]|uniref:5-methyltetrahydropteroyltriglutamate-- homocysteine S-methyltransferase n=1 Tax=Rothia sp. (in: high G+C Gram-positive bacteria) TaxID=1885016 RepID=UPI0026E04168|nr:5-methyltetrahydropteroyltriglutamate--homocysteine S-methyltransferase [Rothia sp. (in: high G+C Gram-positive bacteria)]MDO5750459.1 5-methyltetrahydropteroyltriglutamate--homocysteine S-methyltransferase [Rothia sp. (in: high G+C Gram-positive bacteria)]